MISTVIGWESLPEIPTNRRTQFYLRHDDGAYKYGYDSGDGIAAKQVSTADNQVEGFYSFPDQTGKIVNVQYTAGVQGFVPKTSGDASQSNLQLGSQGSHFNQASSQQTTSNHNGWQSQNKQNVALTHSVPHVTNKPYDESESNFNADASYKISYNTGEHARDETSDAAGNVQGKYSYIDEAGQHDLSYIAGPNIGFKVVGGSLAVPNGQPQGSALKSSFNQASGQQHKASSWNSQGTKTQKSWNTPKAPVVQPASDGSFSYSYNTVDHSRIGGSTAQKSWQSQTVHTQPQPSTDGSYSFSYDTGDHSRQESSDASGRVKGQYSYTNEAGQHDLTYLAGGDSGFVVTGGSLSEPNGLIGKTLNEKPQQQSWSQTPIHVGSRSGSKSQETQKSWQSQGGQQAWQAQGGQQSWKSQGVAQSLNNQVGEPSSDGSYSFSFDTGDQSRTESADASGRVQGKYSYSDEAGQHDLTYVAGGDSGFQVTGGSLSVLNDIGNKAAAPQVQHRSSWTQTPTQVGSSAGSKSQQYGGQQAWQAQGSHDSPAVQTVHTENDGSFSYSYSTDDHSRQESSDRSGQVQGGYKANTGGVKQRFQFEAGPGFDSNLNAGSSSNEGFSSFSNSDSGSDRAFGSRAFSGSEQISQQQDPFQRFRQLYDDYRRSQQGNDAQNFHQQNADRSVQQHQQQQQGWGSAGNENSFQDFNGDNFDQDWGSDEGADGFEEEVFPESVQQKLNNGWVFIHEGPRRLYNTDKSVHPTYTIVAPSGQQRSLNHGPPKNAVILGYLPPEHAEKHGYIYDTQQQ